ncbi:TlpA family protein disulfide reductase [Pedobacter deserti]|uniref:TlpA family protein disulfide reductase n=1 Tax=Pedobacter deserti TaxID=2817382 RepID=UPI00210DB716|nr:TlpA disulfide reductase family protein [Pedobacter sp. SYSU D00382]
MKALITSVMMMTLTFQGFAQTGKTELTDDLVANKDKALGRFVPLHNGTYLYKFYVIPVPEVEQKLKEYRKAMEPEIAKQKTPALQALARKDVDFHARKVMSWHGGLYGMDSVGMANLEHVMTTKKGDPNFTTLIAEAQKKAFVKTLSPDERKAVMDKVYGDAELDNEALFKRSAAYRTWLGDYITYLRNFKYRQDTTMGWAGMPIVKLKVVKAEIPAGFVQDQLNYQYTTEILKMVKDSAAKESAYRSFMSSSKNAAHRKEIETIYANYKMMAGNALSPDFDYADVDGKRVSLKSLRGKYVYIDVWATWCAPCKAEIPFLQKVEHDYAGKNIEFVSLSVDRLADKSKWVSYVKDNKLGGIQVMADKDFSSDFIKKYNINSIPRFILIDPAGKIVAGDAYRPSDPLLRSQLDKLLN